MELPWNLCPYCGTPAPGVRRENMTLDEALSTLALDLDYSEETDESSLNIKEPPASEEETRS